MVKKIILILIALLAGFVVSVLLWRYINYKKDTNPYKTFLLPRVEVLVVNAISLNPEKSEMNIKMLMRNQLPFTFVADSLEYSFLINNVEVLRSRYEKSIKLVANDSSWITVPVTLLNHDLEKVLKAGDRKNVDSVNYEVRTSFYTRFIIRQKVNLDISKRLPLFYIPQVNMEKMDIDSFNFKRAALTFQVAIENENAFPFIFRNIHYRLAIEDNKWVEGKLPGITEIYACGTTRFEVPVRLSIKEVSKTLWTLLKKGQKVKYKLTLTLRNESEIKMIDNTELVLFSSGSVKSLKRTMKSLKN